VHQVRRSFFRPGDAALQLDGTPDADLNGPVGQDQSLHFAGPQTAIQADGDHAHTHTTVFHGTGGSLFGIHLVKTLLTVVTLGLYYY